MSHTTQPKERPILFSTPMVRAILFGHKTQTRRIIKPQPYRDVDGWFKFEGMRPKAARNTGAIASTVSVENWPLFTSPYGMPGDRLWVRETFWKNRFDMSICYLEDMRPEHEPFWVKKPCIHMPRAACRLLLQITDVRVERLQNISAEDAIAEGVQWIPGKDNSPIGAVNGIDSGWKNYAKDENLFYSPISSYETLWTSINGPGSWEGNPWVWVITFNPLPLFAETPPAVQPNTDPEPAAPAAAPPWPLPV